MNDDPPPSTTPPITTKKNLSSINSFEEWKQQQLHADLLSSSCFIFQNNQINLIRFRKRRNRQSKWCVI
jgi:hypothetical protein